MTEAYYLDDEVDGLYGGDEFGGGIRRHKGSMWLPQAHWNRGPFTLLLRTDFIRGVQVINRLLNHAACVRANTLIRPRPWESTAEVVRADVCQVELGLTGVQRIYVGDGHVWLWYRGTGVGPYPCISALLALERFCDQAFRDGASIRAIVSLLLDDCENLAMVSLIVGLLVRHLEDVGDLLDPYLVEPIIWRYEFNRLVQESSLLAANSDGITEPERRKWSLREAAAFLVLHAGEERVADLRSIGKTLVANAHRQLESKYDNQPIEAEVGINQAIEQELVVVRGWASSLDLDRYEAHQDGDHIVVQATPPADVVQALQEDGDDIRRAQRGLQLQYRYAVKSQEPSAEPVDFRQLSDDIATAQDLLENPPPLNSDHAWDVPALVVAAALEANLLYGVDLSDDELAFAVETVLRIGEGEVEPQLFESEQSYFEWGAERSSARVLPLLLSPSAASLRAAVDSDSADGSAAFRRAVAAGMNLARALADEVRLHLARGLDHLWAEPCHLHRPCHHEVGLRLAIESMRDCVIGRWDEDALQRTRLTLHEPVSESLACTPEASIVPSRLDAAIRALAPAATVDICVSTRAHALLTIVLAAQRRSLVAHRQRAHGQNVDHRGTHTLVAARALLMLAGRDDHIPLYDYLDAYADDSDLLNGLLRALSAAAEESTDLAATARSVWPAVIQRVLELNEAGRTPFDGRHYGDMALAALLPNTTPEVGYIYREVLDAPIRWWDPRELQSQVEAWLIPAAGNPECVDQLISFLRALTIEDQARIGLPWVVSLVLADPERIANRTYMLSEWLIETRPVATRVGLSAKWQEVVDALVVAGVSALAPYSE